MVLHIPESVCVLHPSVLTVTVPMQTPSFKVGVGAGGKPALVGIVDGGAEPPPSPLPIEQPGMYSHEATGTTPHEGMSAHSLELSSQ